MTVRILVGDWVDVLRTLPAASVHCVVTSPPYFGLRDYGTAQWVGGDAGCDHKPGNDRRVGATGLQGGTGSTGHKQEGYRSTCGKCGAIRVDSQLGLERTVDEYVARLVAGFREVRRVMRDDAVMFLNLGDAYQDKQLLGVPWRVAFALQADGWWLRSDIVWSKPNPMPESVTDRPTKAHEYVFLLTKSTRYFFDQEAVKEKLLSSPEAYLRAGTSVRENHKYGEVAGRPLGDRSFASVPTGRNIRTVWTIPTEPFSGVVSYGRYRIASPGCPVHDYLADLERAQQCGELPGVSQIAHNPDNGSYPAQGQEGAVAAIPLDQFAFLYGVSAANPHSIESCRMATSSEQDVIFFGIPDGDSSCRELVAHSAAKFAHTRGSRTSAGSAEDDLSPSGQTRFHIVGIETYGAPPEACTCYYTGKPQKRQDHFAAFPTALVEPCIKAGTSQRGACPQCGAPWVRCVERDGQTKRQAMYQRGMAEYGTANGNALNYAGSHDLPERVVTTTGWRPSCECNAGEPVPCVVLDPFFGAGTTGLVADRLQRDCIGIELNPAYAALAERRIAEDAGPMIADVTTEHRQMELFA